MKPVLILTHLDDRQTGLVPDCLRRAGCPVQEIDALQVASLPGVDDVSGIVSLGGRASATRADRDPALSAEVGLLASALHAGIPVLGMCLGAQLLAVAAGGRVTAIGKMYVDWPELSRLPAADGDPVFGELPAALAVLEWHEDMIELPPGAAELATTPARGTALYRVGDRAWGSQAHLEVTPSMLVDTWLAGPSDVAEIEAAGHDIDRFRAQSRSALRAQMPAAEVVFSRFGALAAAAAAAATATATATGAGPSASATVSRQPTARNSAAAQSGSRRR